MAFCVNRNLVTGMPPSVSKAVTNQNDLVTGKVLYFSLWKIRRVIPAKTSLADNPDLKSDNRNNRSFSVDGLRLGITVGAKFRRGSDHFNLPFPGSIQSYRFLSYCLTPA